jgi:hypothetical protein
MQLCGIHLQNPYHTPKHHEIYVREIIHRDQVICQKTPILGKKFNLRKHYDNNKKTIKTYINNVKAPRQVVEHSKSFKKPRDTNTSNHKKNKSKQKVA